MSFTAWVQWGERCAVPLCDAHSQTELTEIIAGLLRSKIGHLPASTRSYLGEYLDTSINGKRQCVAVFDTYLRTGRKKDLLRGAPARAGAVTEEDYAQRWRGYAKTCIRSLCQEVLCKEAGRPGDVSLDIPLGPGETGSRHDLIPDSAPTPEEALATRELEEFALRQDLGERERLILWADQHDQERCSEAMEDLAGCKRSQLSKCAKQLEGRLRAAIIAFYELEPHEEPLAVVWADQAWTTLARQFQKIFPEKAGDGSLVWRERLSVP